MKLIAIGRIYPNPDQPRKHFDQFRLEELAQSIRANGLIEPLVLVRRNSPEGDYMIVAGERRWRAGRIAGLLEVPAEIIEADDRKIAELALLENLQREDLNIIEEANAYQRLLDMGLKQEELAERMGIKQPWRIQERLNLLKLRPVYQDYVLKGILAPSQAQEMSRVDAAYQDVLFNNIRDGKAGTYNKLRALTNAILYRQEQQSFLPEPTEEDRRVKGKYNRMLEMIVRFINSSFNADDLTVLKKVTDSNVKANIEQIDVIMAHLNKIKKAMIQAESIDEVYQQRLEVV
jgi:ParB family chromosome partitioning protein